MFCKYCGKEHLDEAIVCPHCGMMLKQIPTPVAAAPAAKPVAKAPVAVGELEKATKLAKLFGMFAAIAIAMTFFLIVATIASMGSFSMTHYSLWDEDLVIFSWLFGWTALGMGITSFILSVKQSNYAVKYVSLVLFIFSILAYLAPTMFLSF